MNDAATRRRDYLATVLTARTHGHPVTTHHAVRILAQSPWATAGRNTARKDLRALAARGVLASTVDLTTGRRQYLINTRKDAA